MTLEASDLPRLRKEYDLANESTYSVLADVCVDGYMDLIDLAERQARELAGLRANQEAIIRHHGIEGYDAIGGVCKLKAEEANLQLRLADSFQREMELTARIAALESQLAARRAGERERLAALCRKALDEGRQIMHGIDRLTVRQCVDRRARELADEFLKGE